MSSSRQPIRLYRHPISGHSHRVQLFLSLLNLPHELIDVDLRKGEHKQAAFLEKNPFGQVPVIEDGDVTVYDSNAILVYLASRYDARWLGADPQEAAVVQRWLSLAAGPLAFGPSAARAAVLVGRPTDMERARAIAADLFGVLERELTGRAFALGERPSIADIALYSYTAHAPEGGIALDPYPALRAWIGRVEALPGFVPMMKSGQARAA